MAPCAARPPIVIGFACRGVPRKDRDDLGLAEIGGAPRRALVHRHDAGGRAPFLRVAQVIVSAPEADVAWEF